MLNPSYTHAAAFFIHHRGHRVSQRENLFWALASDWYATMEWVLVPASSAGWPSGWWAASKYICGYSSYLCHPCAIPPQRTQSFTEKKFILTAMEWAGVPASSAGWRSEDRRLYSSYPYNCLLSLVTHKLKNLLPSSTCMSSTRPLKK